MCGGYRGDKGVLYRTRAGRATPVILGSVGFGFIFIGGIFVLVGTLGLNSELNGTETKLEYMEPTYKSDINTIQQQIGDVNDAIKAPFINANGENEYTLNVTKEDLSKMEVEINFFKDSSKRYISSLNSRARRIHVIAYILIFLGCALFGGFIYARVKYYGALSMGIGLLSPVLSTTAFILCGMFFSNTLYYGDMCDQVQGISNRTTEPVPNQGVYHFVWCFSDGTEGPREQMVQ